MLVPPDITLPANTFQAVVITDGFQSYTVFTYACGLLQWNTDNTAIGYSAGGYNFVDSFSGPNASDIDCSRSDSLFTNRVFHLSK